MNAGWLEDLFQWRLIRFLASLALLARAGIYSLLGARYRALADYCRVVRVSGIDSLQRLASMPVYQLIQETRATGHNRMIEWYRQSSLSRHCASTYALAGAGPNDLFRDLIVLKAATATEKGVILLKYARTFEAVIAMLDFDLLRSRYFFVLEPCWAGYCDPALLMYFDPAHPTLVQCFTDEDFSFVEGLGWPLVPLRLGPADWVNSDVFQRAGTGPKSYDLVMVANWGAHKRHRVLFDALRRLHDREIRLLLVGFPWANRTADDIRREAARIGNDRVRVEIVEGLSHAELAGRLAMCKAFVFLSRKEGDNKALVEAMFADLPAIVYDRSIGGARGRVNPETGMLSSDEGLVDAIRHMQDHHAEFSPRKWALSHTGGPLATKVVDDALRSAMARVGGRYETGIVEKINAPNLAYRDPAWRTRFQADYDYLKSSLRQPGIA